MSSSLNITADQIENWKRQVSDIKHKIATLRADEQRLDELIHAANLLSRYGMPSNPTQGETKVERKMPGMLDVPRPIVPGVLPAPTDEGPTLVDAIIMALRAAGKPQSNKDIKAKLSGTGFDTSRLKKSPNYFYTATKRLVDRGDIEKLKDGRYNLVKESAPDEDNLFGSSSGASNHTGSNQSGEPRAQGREAVPGGGP